MQKKERKFRKAKGKNSRSTRRSNDNLGYWGSVVFLSAGMLFLFAAFALFLVSGYLLYRLHTDPGLPQFFSPETVKEGEMTAKDIYGFYGKLFSVYLAPLLLMFSGIVCAFVGKILLRAAGAVSRLVIPPREYALLPPAVREGKEDGVKAYVRLSGLSGYTAAFAKIGLTGLPLATIVLTIILAIIGLFDQRFFDLAQLTLGAFIGSYVQKRREK